MEFLKNGPKSNFLIRTVCRIKSFYKDKNNDQVGTGFFVKTEKHLLLITCYHLIENCYELEFEYITVKDREIVTYKNDDHCGTGTYIKNINYKRDNEYSIIINDEHKRYWNEKLDLAIFLMEEYFDIKDYENIDYLNIENFYQKDNIPYDKLCDIEDVIIIGHPDGKLCPSELYPIVRKGITSTSVNSSSNQFCIDFSVYGGFSGSPVFYYEKEYKHGNFNSKNERFYFLGMLQSSSEIDENLISKEDYENLIDENKELKNNKLLKLISHLKIIKNLDISYVLNSGVIYKFLREKELI